MSPQEKIRVAVLYGGRSAEHEISLQSAQNVIQYLDPALFDIVPIGIDRNGSWFLGQETFAKSLEKHKVAQLIPDHSTWFSTKWVSKAIDSKEVVKQLNGLQFDVVFPVLHGSYCEDGSLQGLLELADVPYVGCGVLSSAIGMDKDVSKRLASEGGIKVPPFLTIKYDHWIKHANEFIENVNKYLIYPVFVKPANAGSSIGINKIKDYHQLAVAIDEAFKFDTKVIIEQGLDVTEIEVAVLESLEIDEDPIISVVGEIRPNNHEFYSYDAKYIDENGAKLIIPACISSDHQKEARKIAGKLFKILECDGMARVDLFVEKRSQTIFFNEINTIPGFTKISMYPKLLDASGISYQNLLTHLVKLAMKKHQAKNKLMRSYVE